MCWAVPAVVVKIEGDTALVDLGDGVPRPVVIGVDASRIAPGSLVLAHAGVIISVLDLNSLEEMKRQYVDLFKDMASLTGEDPERAAREAEEAFNAVLERARKYAEGRPEVEHGQFAIW